MLTILQINVTANSGSTGKIAEQINGMAIEKGWKVYLMYGRDTQPCQSELIHIGNMMQVYEHYAEHRFFDNDGLASRLATRQAVREIERIHPDIIHLHNIHDHWLNYRILFEYLNTLNIPIVWTQHDCWSFTGDCAHFTLRGCFKWREGGCTNNCPIRRNAIMRRFFEKTENHYQLKKRLFTETKDLTIVPVSHWLEGLLQQSFLKNKHITTIHNGIDISTFQPVDSVCVRKKYGIGTRRYIIGVSSVWLPYKGWNDFVRLSNLLPKGVMIVLVGLNGDRIKVAEQYGIIGIPKTENVQELAALYSGAMMFCNLTYEDNYPTTNLEAMACGTPVLTYRTGGSVESVTEETGWIVEQGDLESVVKIVETRLWLIETTPSVDIEMRYRCRERAEKEFNKNDRFMEYLDLYNELITQ